MKTISFEEDVRHFGHPISDYKKDGTLKKNRTEPRIYYILEKVEHECEEVVVDGKFLGYIKTDCEYSPIFNDKGKCINIAYATFSGDTLHENGFEFYRGEKDGRWFMYDLGLPSNWNAYPLWICDDEGNPKYIIKDNYELAKEWYAFLSWLNNNPELYCSYSKFKTLIRLKSEWRSVEEKFGEEFDRKFKNSVIDIKNMTPREYKEHYNVA